MTWRETFVLGEIVWVQHLGIEPGLGKYIRSEYRDDQTRWHLVDMAMSTYGLDPSVSTNYIWVSDLQITPRSFCAKCPRGRREDDYLCPSCRKAINVNTRKADFQVRVRGSKQQAIQRCHDHGLVVSLAKETSLNAGVYCICRVAAENGGRLEGWESLMAWREEDQELPEHLTEMMDHITPAPLFDYTWAVCLACEHRGIIPADDYVCLACRKDIDDN